MPVVVACALLGTATAVVPPASAAAVAGNVQGTQSVPVYSYSAAVHESVSIRTPVDSDNDGVRDRVVLDIIRPAEAASNGVKVPVILDASPYFECCGRGNEAELKYYASDGTIATMPLFYDNYFVPRGFAVAALDLTGTERSTGCPDVGGRSEVLGAKAAIDWLNGRARGVDLQGTPVTADWSNGRVGMIGKSWDASVANGVAATGVDGLRTVVAISGISSWYDYTRFGGVVRMPRLTGDLAHTVNGRPSGVCRDVIADEQRASDDRTGSFNDFWRARDYRTHADRVRAAMFLVHGLNDTNVTTTQFASWWSALGTHRVPRKLWLAQTGHVDPFDFRRKHWVDTLHHWFDHWLLGLDNGVMSEPRVDVQRPSGRWLTTGRWPSSGAASDVVLSKWAGARTRSLTDRPELGENLAVARPNRTVPGRLAFVSRVRRTPLHVAGGVSLTLRLRADRADTEITARLVDYGRQRRVDYQSDGAGITTAKSESCWGQSTDVDDACYRDTALAYVTSDVDIITRGWLDAAHHVSLARVTPLVPNRWYRITVRLNPTDTVVQPGHRLGVVVALSDEESTAPRATGATVQIDPTRSVLHLSHT